MAMDIQLTPQQQQALDTQAFGGVVGEGGQRENTDSDKEN